MMLQYYRLFVRLRPILRAVLFVQNNWFGVALATFVLSPVGPHLNYGGGGIMGGVSYSNACLYFGSRGTVRTYHHGPHCPLIVALDSRNRRP